MYRAEVRAWLRQARWRFWRRFRPALYQQKVDEVLNHLWSAGRYKAGKGVYVYV